MPPDRLHKVVHEAFRHVREFLEELHIQLPSALDQVEEAMANLEPLDDAKNQSWNALVETVDLIEKSGPDEARARAMGLHDAFRELIGPLAWNLPSKLPWYFNEPSVRNIALVATDIRGVPVPAIRPIAVHDLSVKIDMTGPHTYIIGGDNTYTTVQDGEFSWTLLHDPQLNENRIPVSQDLPFTQLFIPVEYWNDKIFGAAIFGIDSSTDTTLFLRSALEEFGLYKTRAVVTENIQLFNINGPKETSESSFLGFGVKELPQDEWVKLLDVAPLVKMGLPPTQGTLNDEIMPAIAAIALQNLKRIYYMLKELGIAMRSFDHLVVNKKTGEVYLGEGDRPVLVNVQFLDVALANPTMFLDSIYSKDVWPHFPNLVVVGRSRELMAGDSQLMLVIKLLADRSGEPYSIKENTSVSQIMEDLRLLAHFLRDPVFIDSVKDKNKTLSSIAEYYLDVLGTNGILNFFGIVIGEIIRQVKPERWLFASISLINEALHSGERNIDNYWAKNIGRIQAIDCEGSIKNGSGNSGTQSSPANGGRGPVNDSGDPQIGQAKGSTVAGMFTPNETSAGNTVYFPGAQMGAYMQAAAYQRTDVASHAIPYNLNLAFWSGIRVFAPSGSGTVPIVN